MKVIDKHTDWVDRKGVIETAANWSKRTHCKALVDKGIPYQTACQMAGYDELDAIEDLMRRSMAWAAVGFFAFLIVCIFI